MRMELITDDFEILEFVIGYGLRLPLDGERWQGQRIARQLLFHLLQMIQVQVAITAGQGGVRIDEFVNVQSAGAPDSPLPTG